MKINLFMARNILIGVILGGLIPGLYLLKIPSIDFNIDIVEAESSKTFSRNIKEEPIIEVSSYKINSLQLMEAFNQNKEAFLAGDPTKDPEWLIRIRKQQEEADMTLSSSILENTEEFKLGGNSGAGSGVLNYSFDDLAEYRKTLANVPKADVMNLVEIYTENSIVPKEYVIAIIEEESGFDRTMMISDAQDNTLYIGLGMISTRSGEDIARQLGIRDYSHVSLFEPEINLRMMVHILERAMSESDNPHYVFNSYKFGNKGIEEGSKPTYYSERLVAKVGGN